MEPELTGIRTHDPPDLNEAGATLFVPWYLLKDEGIRLADLADQLRIYRDTAHLKGWLDRGHGVKDPLGKTRLANLMKLYRFRRLALASRYELAGRVERLDIAFGEFLKLDPQSIRKLRLAAKWGANG